MKIESIKAKSILRKRKKIDSWFISHYGMNLYRGCLHNCVYCDGRAEKYQVSGEFGSEIGVKINAMEILKRELDPSRKRKPFKRSYVILGGGVGDSYQKIESEYQISREALLQLGKHEFPVHVLTKSTLVRRDIALLKRIHSKSGVLVSFSFSSVDDRLSSIFEPGVQSPSERMSLIRELKAEGIPSGAFLMPVLPFITDTQEILEESIVRLKEAGVEYIIFGGMTLKRGRQKDYFDKVLKKQFPELVSEYNALYSDNKYGQADYKYYNSINKKFLSYAKVNRIPPRIPSSLFKDILSPTDLIIVILEQMDYVLKSMGEKSPYGYGAFSISQLTKPINEFFDNFQTIKGIGPVTERIIREILQTKSSNYYNKLMNI